MRAFLLIGALALVSFVAVVGLQAGGGLRVWGIEVYELSEDGKKSGYTFGLKRLWLKEQTNLYVDYATDIESGAIYFVLVEIPSLGEQPARPVERRVTATDTGTASFLIRRDGMYRLEVRTGAASKWSAQKPVLRYKIKWGLDNPDVTRKEQVLDKK